MAKVKVKNIEEIRGEFVIKTNLGYYVDRDNEFDMTELYSDNVINAEVFSLNLIALWHMEALNYPKIKELVNLNV